MHGRKQWTVIGTALVLGWGAGVTGATIALNDAEVHPSFGAAVTLDTAKVAAPASATPAKPRATPRPAADSPSSPGLQRSTPRPVPAAPPRAVADSPAPAPAGDDSAASGASADSAD